MLSPMNGKYTESMYSLVVDHHCKFERVSRLLDPWPLFLLEVAREVIGLLLWECKLSGQDATSAMAPSPKHSWPVPTSSHLLMRQYQASPGNLWLFWGPIHPRAIPIPSPLCWRVKPFLSGIEIWGPPTCFICKFFGSNAFPTIAPWFSENMGVSVSPIGSLPFKSQPFLYFQRLCRWEKEYVSHQLGGQTWWIQKSTIFNLPQEFLAKKMSWLDQTFQGSVPSYIPPASYLLLMVQESC